MGKGTYRGGSTIIGPHSFDWYAKPIPLEDRIRSQVEAKRQSFVADVETTKVALQGELAKAYERQAKAKARAEYRLSAEGREERKRKKEERTALRAAEGLASKIAKKYPNISEELQGLFGKPSSD